MKAAIIDEQLDDDINKTIWVDGLRQQVMFRKEALPDIMKHIQQLETED